MGQSGASGGHFEIETETNTRIPERVQRIYAAAYLQGDPETAQFVIWAAINGLRYQAMERLPRFTMTRSAFNAALCAVLEAVDAAASPKA